MVFIFGATQIDIPVGEDTAAPDVCRIGFGMTADLAQRGQPDGETQGALPVPVDVHQDAGAAQLAGTEDHQVPGSDITLVVDIVQVPFETVALHFAAAASHGERSEGW